MNKIAEPRAEEAHRRVEDLKDDIKLLRTRIAIMEEFYFNIRGFVKVVTWLSIATSLLAAIFAALVKFKAFK